MNGFRDSLGPDRARNQKTLRLAEDPKRPAVALGLALPVESSAAGNQM